MLTPAMHTRKRRGWHEVAAWVLAGAAVGLALCWVLGWVHTAVSAVCR